MRKATTGEVIDRIVEMVRVLHRKPLSRQQLADRWRVTPRQVSNTIENAEAWFGVRVEYREYGYEVVDTGLLDPERIAELPAGGRR